MPNFPTDNLYKFMSIFGLALLLYGLITPFFVLSTNLEKIEKVAVEAAELSARIELLPQTLEINPPNRGDTKRARELLEGNADLKAMNAGLRVKIDIVHRLNKQNLFVIVASIIASVIGLSLSGVGFYLWYIRVQKYEDIVMVLNALNNSSKKDEQEARASS